MGDSYNDPQQNRSNFGNSRDGGRGSFRGGRGGNHREGGGFRIRLSENEMRSSRIIQDAFNLRSPVAVLGFSVRTLAELLEQGKLDDFVNEYRTQGPKGTNQGATNSRNNQLRDQREGFSSAEKPNPFARPSKPEPKSQESTSGETITPNKSEEQQIPAEEIEVNTQPQENSAEIIKAERNSPSTES